MASFGTVHSAITGTGISIFKEKPEPELFVFALFCQTNVNKKATMIFHQCLESFYELRVRNHT